MNEFKQKLFRSASEMQSYRLLISQEQLDDFWKSKTLQQMQRILTINDKTLMEILGQYLWYYLSKRKANTTETYTISKDGKELASIYDCRLFKQRNDQKSHNEFLSSLLIAYKYNDIALNTPLFQIIDNSIFDQASEILKVKSSSILRIYSLINAANIQPLNNDIIIIPKHYYGTFIQMWLHTTNGCGIQFFLKYFFKGILVLFHNQIMLSFYQSLTFQQRHQKQYNLPLKRIKKPKNKEEFTMPEKRFGQIKWHKLKIEVFRLKYKVIEQEDQYLCYRQKHDQKNENKELNFNQLDAEDKKIFFAFQTVLESNFYKGY